MNPLLQKFDTPPFSKLNVDIFSEAIDEAIVRARADIDAIAESALVPTFQNTIEAYEKAGEDLERVLGVFFPLLSADADEKLMELSVGVSQKLSDYSADVSLNEKLFERIKYVYDHRDRQGEMTAEQTTLLTDMYLGFTRSGALLKGDDREKYRAITARLSELTTLFGQNVKKELATYRIDVDSPERMAGLPQHIVDDAAALARSEGRDASWTLTLDQPVYMAVMKLADDASLREQMYRLYTARNSSGEFDNRAIVCEIAELRLKLGNLLGFPDFASYKLERTMAETPENVYSLLNRLKNAYLPALRQEISELEEFVGAKLNPWDYSYQANRLRRKLHGFDEETLRPYFELNNVIDGVFGLATRLYGIKFEPVGPEVEVYHPDVKVFRVNDADGSELGLLYTDFFPRAGRKSPGAWMTEFREADATTRPQVNIVMNFTKPGAGRPSLLTPSEVETFLHEFGHSLHSLLTRAHYGALSGTNVRRDFVELPSQFMENFLTLPEFLNSFARHYQTGELLPAEQIRRLKDSRSFGAAYACVRQLSFGFLDMAWHTITEPVSDPVAFERKAIADVTPIPTPQSAVTSLQFGHIFSGGYAAGYYSYKWAEVLDADAFAMFEEKDPFSGEPAAAFRREILERGGTEHPAVLYERFRGRPASISALLRRDNIPSDGAQCG